MKQSEMSSEKDLKQLLEWTKVANDNQNPFSYTQPKQLEGISYRSTNERTSTQKLPMPELDHYDYNSVNMWWQNFVHHVKMTCGSGSSELSSFVYRNKMPSRKRQKSLENEKTRFNLFTSHTHGLVAFTPKNNKYDSRINDFELKREPK